MFSRGNIVKLMKTKHFESKHVSKIALPARLTLISEVNLLIMQKLRLEGFSVCLSHHVLTNLSIEML